MSAVGARQDMTEARNGIEFLENLRKRNGKEQQTFDAFSSYLSKRAREQGVPLYAELELTSLCNLSCKMCYVHLNAAQMQGRGLLSVEQWKDLIDQAYAAGLMNVTLTGGECLTYPGFRDLFLYLHSLGCEVSVYTNGVLLDQEWIDFFKLHTPARIQVTLYGDSEETYEQVTGFRVFSRVVEHIRMMQEADLPVSLCITPSRYLGENVFDTLRTAHKLNRNTRVNSNLFKPKEETGRSRQEDDPDVEMYIRIYRMLASLNGVDCKKIDESDLPETGCPKGTFQDSNEVRGVLCGAGRSSFTIDWKGRMVPCSMLDMIEAFPLRDGFESAWRKINQAVNQWPRPADCEDCAYRSVCNNCAAYMFQFVKPGETPYDLCRNTKKLVSAGVYRIPECI